MSHSDSKDPISSWIAFPNQLRVLPPAKLCAVTNKIKYKSLKTSYLKGGLTLIPGEHLKRYLQENFE